MLSVLCFGSHTTLQLKESELRRAEQANELDKLRSELQQAQGHILALTTRVSQLTTALQEAEARPAAVKRKHPRYAASGRLRDAKAALVWLLAPLMRWSLMLLLCQRARTQHSFCPHPPLPRPNLTRS
jgi:hypothetical protein